MEKMKVIGRIAMLILLIAAAAVMAGCASYSAKGMMPTQIDESKVVKIEKESISISVIPIISEQDNKKYFDENLLEKNVVAVYVSIINNNATDVELISSNLSVQSYNMPITHYPPLSVEEVYPLIKRSWLGKSAFWMSFTYFIGAPVSAMHTSSVNKKIKEDLQGKYLAFQVIKYKASIQGFSWFRLSDDTITEMKKGKSRLILRLILGKGGKLLECELSSAISALE